METIGIIAEYNPFHNGHKYMLQQVKDKLPHAHIIVAMSGSYTQRGEAAIFDKWQRAASAVKNGASLVLEIPFVFVARSAQFFAQGGIQLLNRLNSVNYLAFGAETDDLSLLKEIAEIEINNSLTKYNLHSGISYASAINKSISAAIPDADNVLKEPNNILAIEYLRTLKKLNSSIKPLIIKRMSASYHSDKITGTIASATAIRKSLLHTPDLKEILSVIPPNTYESIQNALSGDLPDEDALLRTLLMSIRMSTAEELKKIYGINEGLENVLYKAAAQANVSSIAELCLSTKSKRYTYARIKRILLYILLQLTGIAVDNFTQAGPQYARILAFNSEGRKLINQLKKTTEIPLIDRPAKILKSSGMYSEILTEMLQCDIKATELRNLSLANIPSLNKDFTTPPIFVNSSN